MDKKRIVVLASGNGSNLQALIDAVKNGSINGEVVLVLSNKKDAFALERAKRANIQTEVIMPTDFNDRARYDQAIIAKINDYGADLVVLAGYMLICSKAFVNEFYGCLINLHPSLLPSFPGANGIRDALNYGVKITGVTVHFVDEGCDTGPIIFQEALDILEDETEESLAQKIHETEHHLLVKAVKYFVEGRLELKGRQVVIN